MFGNGTKSNSHANNKQTHQRGHKDRAAQLSMLENSSSSTSLREVRNQKVLVVAFMASMLMLGASQIIPGITLLSSYQPIELTLSVERVMARNGNKNHYRQIDGTLSSGAAVSFACDSNANIKEKDVLNLVQLDWTGTISTPSCILAGRSVLIRWFVFMSASSLVSLLLLTKIIT
jgi:hypothetical protein